jgi:hypothetical protein
MMMRRRSDVDKATAALSRIADDINDYQSFSEGFDEQDWYGEEDWDFDANVPKDGTRRFEASTQQDWDTLRRVIALAREVTAATDNARPSAIAMGELRTLVREV